MTQARREQLHSLMMGNTGDLKSEAPKLYRELEDMILGNLDKLEPVIDEWIREAFQDGKEFGLKKAVAA